MQLYVAAPQDGLYRPLRELKGFVKVFLQPGESRNIAFDLDDRSFAVWADGWKVPGGKYVIELGASSEDIRLCGEIAIEGEDVPVPAWQKGSWYEAPYGLPSDSDFEMLYGGPIQPEPEIKKGSFTMEMSSMEMKDHSAIMKNMFKMTEKTIAQGFGGKIDYSDPAFKMMVMSGADSPLRAAVISSGGALPANVAEAMIAMANGQPLDSLKALGSKKEKKPEKDKKENKKFGKKKEIRMPEIRIGSFSIFMGAALSWALPWPEGILQFISQIRSVSTWSAKGNHLDIPTDCPTRKRHGWTGDTQIFFESAGILFAGSARRSRLCPRRRDHQSSFRIILNIPGPSQSQGRSSKPFRDKTVQLPLY